MNLNDILQMRRMWLGVLVVRCEPKVWPLHLLSSTCMPTADSRRAMKTASLGLLEVIVVRAYAGGECPPGPPSLCVFFFCK
jgi:hypothetical protein